MKLYYVANIRMPTEKAHGIQIMKMCEAFALLNNQVELVVPKRKNHITTDPFEFYEVKNTFTIKKLATVDVISWGRIGFWIQSLFFALEVVRYIRNKTGIFYTRDELQAFILKLFGKKVVWEIHMGQMNLLARMNLRLKIPLVVVTKGLKDVYLKKGIPETNIHIAHDAVDLELFKEQPQKDKLKADLSLPHNKKIIAYIGKYKTLGQSKGVTDVIQPFVEMLQFYPDIFLLFVGLQEDEMHELSNQLMQTGISSASYKIVGHVSHAQAISYMIASDILLMMYPYTTHYAYYMSPLKLFEYMASGSAILTSDLPSIREVVDDDSVFFYSPHDPQTFSHTLLEAISHDSLRVRKAEQARHLVNAYTWKVRASDILKFINEKA